MSQLYDVKAGVQASVGTCQKHTAKTRMDGLPFCISLYTCAPNCSRISQREKKKGEGGKEKKKLYCIVCLSHVDSACGWEDRPLEL